MSTNMFNFEAKVECSDIPDKLKKVKGDTDVII